MTLVQGIIIHSIQTLQSKLVNSLEDYSSVTFNLCSFCGPESEIPFTWGYFGIPANEVATASYNLCSFSVPESEIPFEWGYAGTAINEIATASYDLCSFSVPESELPSGYAILSSGNDRTNVNCELCSFSVPRNEITNVYPLALDNIDASRISIYGLSTNAFEALSADRLSFYLWEASSADTGGFVSLPFYSATAYFSGGISSSLDASIQPITVRQIVGYQGKTYRSSPITLTPFQDIEDIPNLQLWLDAADTSTLTVSAPLNDTSWYFPGNATVTGGSGGYLFPSNSFTIELWINFASVGGTQNIVSTYSTNYYGTQSTFGWRIILTGGKIVVGFNGPSTNITSSTSPVPNRWYHIAVTGQTGSYKLYIDGVQEGGTYTGGRAASERPLRLGAFLSYNNYLYLGVINYLNASISNLRIVDGVTVYTSTFNPYVSAAVPLQPIGTSTLMLAFQGSTLTNAGINGTISTDPALVQKTPLYVTEWRDKSPMANKTTQTVFPLTPTIKNATSINSLTAVSFNGINNYLDLFAATDVGGNFTSFFMYDRESDADMSVSLGNDYTTSNTSPLLHYSDGIIYSGNERSNSAYSIYGGISIASVRKNQRLLVSDPIYNWTQINAPEFTSNWGGTKHTTVNSIGIYNNTYYHKNKFFEYIQTSSMLPDNEMSVVMEKLKNKWLRPDSIPLLLSNGSWGVRNWSIPILTFSSGTWTGIVNAAGEPDHYIFQVQRSSDGSIYTDIPGASAVIRQTQPTPDTTVMEYIPVTADYGTFLRASVIARNSVGTGQLSYTTNVPLLTAYPISPTTIYRTTIFTAQAIPGNWYATTSLNRLYQWETSVNSGTTWVPFGSLTSQTLADFSSFYTGAPFDVRVTEYVYNSYIPYNS